MTPQEQAARDLAFYYYLQQPHHFWHNGKRSKKALFRYWVDQAREKPEEIEAIPTRNWNKLLEWATEDEWERRAEEYDAQQADEARRKAESHRRWAVDQLSAHISDAIKALVAQINNPKTPAAAKNKSIEILLDRVGVIDQSKLPVAKRPDPKDAEREKSRSGDVGPSPSALSNMSEEELIDVLQRKRNEI